MIPKPATLLLHAAGTAFAFAAYLQTGLLAERPDLLPFVALEAATFGAGTAFLALAWPRLRDSVSSHRAARVGHASAAWILLTWAPADTVHAHFGHRALDVLFSVHAYHATLVAAGLGLAYYVRRLVGERNALLAAARAGAPADHAAGLVPGSG